MQKPKGPIPGNPVLPDRPDWQVVFGRPTRALHLELGSGHGGFAVAFAAAHPEVDFVALEWRKKFADWTRARGAERQLRNLLVVQADARLEVPRLFSESSVDVVHVQFPDPWWKRRHHKRRLLDADFAPLLLAVLRPGGLLDVRTDVADRGEEMRRQAEAAGFINEAGPGRFSDRALDDIPSTREKRYLAADEPVYRLRLRRPDP